MNFNKKDAVADAVKSILQTEEGSCVTPDKAKKIAKKEVHGHEEKMHKEEIDINDRTQDTLVGREKTKQKDDVGPGGNFKRTKVRFHAGPKNESLEEPLEKVLADTAPHTGIIKTVMANELPDPNRDHANKKQLKMKESISLKGFKERYEEHSIFEQMVQEVLSKDASAGQWIHDFVHSDNPKFAGKSKAERKKQALAAYYAKQRNEEVEQVEEAMGEKAAGNLDFISKVKGVAKKVGRVLGGPDDEGHKKDLQRKMGIPQTGKPSMAKQNEEAEQVEEAWDDMVKAAKGTLKDKPQDGSSGVKKGFRYGGSKQKDKPEQDDDKKKVNEAKRPEDDSVPFDPPYNTTSQPVTQDKSGAKHTPMSRAHHLARLAMSRVKKDLGSKKGN
jgi:hypothetical protein